jgi:hypothetical protein
MMFPNILIYVYCCTVFPFQTELTALDFLKKGAAKQEEIDLILAEVHVSTMASGTLANSELLNHITNELHVPFVCKSLYLKPCCFKKVS